MTELNIATATDLSRMEVDRAHREEIATARAEVERLNMNLDYAITERDEACRERASLRNRCTLLSEGNRRLTAQVTDLTGERDRARDLAVRAGAFDTARPPWEVAPDWDAVARPPASTETDQRGNRAWIGPADDDRGSEFGVEREQDDGR